MTRQEFIEAKRKGGTLFKPSLEAAARGAAIPLAAALGGAAAMVGTAFAFTDKGSALRRGLFHLAFPAALTGMCLTRDKGIADQREAWLEDLNAEVAAAGLGKLTGEERAGMATAYNRHYGI